MYRKLAPAAMPKRMHCVLPHHYLQVLSPGLQPGAELSFLMCIVANHLFMCTVCVNITDEACHQAPNNYACRWHAG